MTPEQLADLDNALLSYWTSRDEARVAQQARGREDVGGRAGVTSGGHLDRVAQLLANVCIEAGVPRKHVYYKAPKDDPNRRGNINGKLTLPGYYRPTKQWDLVVYHQDHPIVAVELKSQNGPSYGNNANNRAEEAIGNAVDLADACEAGRLPRKPWLGYVYVIEDDVRSRHGEDGGRKSGLPSQDLIFADCSYVRRVELLCKRLVGKNRYDRAWAVMTSRPDCPAGPEASLEKLRKDCAQYKINKKVVPKVHEHTFSWTELDPAEVGYVQFITALTAEIGKHYSTVPSSGVPDIST